MKKIKQLNTWGIYQNNAKEIKEYGFAFTVVHPNNMGCALLSPSDSDWECDTLEEAESWVKNYG